MSEVLTFKTDQFLLGDLLKINSSVNCRYLLAIDHLRLFKPFIRVAQSYAVARIFRVSEPSEGFKVLLEGATRHGGGRDRGAGRGIGHSRDWSRGIAHFRVEKNV